jgi:hypothetical protein
MIQELASTENRAAPWLSLLSIAGVLYAIGLLIFTIYLGYYNVINVDLARPQYILVGVLWVTLHGIPFAIYLHLGRIRLVRRRTTGRFLNYYYRVLYNTVASEPYFYCSLLRLIILAAIVTYVLYEYSQATPTNIEWCWTLTNGWALIMWFSSSIFAGRTGRALLFRRRFAAEPAESSNRLTLLSIALATLLSLFFYTAVIFPYISRAVGGGKEVFVQIVFSDNVPPSILNELPMSSDKNRTCSVPELLETDKVIFVDVYRATAHKIFAIAVSKEFVTAIIYQNRTQTEAKPRGR